MVSSRRSCADRPCLTFTPELTLQSDSIGKFAAILPRSPKPIVRLIAEISSRSAALPRSILALHGGALVDTRDLPCTNANHANVGRSVLFASGQSVGTMRPVAAPCPRQIALPQNHRPPAVFIVPMLCRLHFCRRQPITSWIKIPSCSMCRLCSSIATVCMYAPTSSG